MFPENPECIVNATLDKKGSILLPKPEEIESPAHVVYAACLVLPSQGKYRIVVRRDWEIVYSKA